MVPQDANVLIIAFHFPPQAGSSGYLRSLKFCRYLPQSGWRPIVLTAHPRAYEQRDQSQLEQVPRDVPVVQAFALDAKRHFGFRDSYWRLTALPDRWASWCLGAIPRGLRLIRKNRVDVILSTFPIATAVLIGLVLHRMTGKPWVVDFRDTMTEDDYPRDVLTRRVWSWLERQAVRHAARLIFTAPSAMQAYLRRYPSLPQERCLLIHNGYDDEDFGHLLDSKSRKGAGDRPLRLLHTGLLYPEERDPRPFFHVLSRLKNEGKIRAADLRIEFRAPGFEAEYARILNELQLEDLVHLLPRVPYQRALQECAEADGLLLFQAAWCDRQIPAKAYEYLRVRRPIFALTTHAGDTAALLRQVGGATIVDLADEKEIYQGFPEFMRALRSGTHALPDEQKIQPYARQERAKELARCLWEVKSAASAEAAQAAESFSR